MRAIARRLSRVEERLRPAANTEHQRRLGTRLEAARQRMARCGYTFAAVMSKGEDPTPIEILMGGRQKAFERNAAEEPSTGIRACRLMNNPDRSSPLD